MKTNQRSIRWWPLIYFLYLIPFFVMPIIFEFTGPKEKIKQVGIELIAFSIITLYCIIRMYREIRRDEREVKELYKQITQSINNDNSNNNQT